MSDKIDLGDLTYLTRRRLLGTAGAVATTALFPGLAACGGGDDKSSAPKAAGKITLTWWDYFQDTNEKAVKDRIERYKAVKPNVTITRTYQPFPQLKQKLLQGATAGDLPDMVVIDNPDHSSFAALGVLTDISDQVKSWGQRDAYFEGPFNSTVYKDKVYGIPDNSNCLALWANTELLKSAKVDIPSTFDELRSAAETLTSGKTKGLAVSAVKSEEGTFQWLPFLWATGADVQTLDSDGGRTALQLWVDLVNKGQMSKGIINWDQGKVLTEFQNKRAALMVNGPWQIGTLRKDSPKLKWEVAPMPKQSTSASVLGGENMAITVNTKNADAAWEFIEWSQRPENLLRYNTLAGKIPSRKDVAENKQWTDDPALRKFVEQLQVAKPRNYGPKYPEISAAIQDMFQGALSGKTPVPEAVSTAAKKIKPLLTA